MAVGARGTALPSVRRLELSAHSPRVPATVGDALAALAADRPEHVAVADPRGHLSYAELCARSAAVATSLGGTLGGPVLVLADYGCPAVTAMYGVARTGRPYAVLDPTVPHAARAAVAEQFAGAPVLVQDRHAPSAARMNHPAVTLDLAATGAFEKDVSPSAPLFVSWTSGSSGRPKGVIHSHRNALVNGGRVRDAFLIRPDDRLLSLAPLGLVGPVTPMFAALASGATFLTYVLSQEGPGELAAFVDLWRPTMIQASPGRARTLSQHLRGSAATEAVRVLLIGGDVLTGAHVRELRETFPQARVIHRYSTSETNWVIGCEVSDAPEGSDGPVPLGWPVPWLEVEVESGELLVAGDSLATGYFGDESRTREAFTVDGGRRRYRTRDIVRVDAQSAFHLVGRRDNVRKVNGVLVDLDEIDRFLRSCAGVGEACTVTAARPNGGELIVAYVSFSGSERTGSAVRRELAESLPMALMPSTVEVLPALPTLPNGKVDRQGLARRAAARVAPHRSPRTARERDVAQALADVLNVPSLAADDDFYSLGADSLDTAEAIERLEPVLGRRLSAADLVENPTPERLAALSGPPLRRRRLVHVASGDHGRPALVLSSGGGGAHVETMAALAREIGAHDAYVAVPRGFESREGVDRSIGSMAQTIVAAVDQAVGNRPTVFIGQSGGGFVMLEASVRRADTGGPPSPVVMLDTSPPQRRLGRLRRRLAMRAREMGVPNQPPWRRPYGYLRAWLRPRRWWWQISTGWIRSSEEQRLNQFSVLRNHALYAYRPRGFSGVVLVVRARDEDRTHSLYPDPGGWTSWVDGHCTLVDVPGTHRTMSLPPHVPTTAAAIRAFLDDLAG